MSHFSEIKTHLTDKRLLQKALRNLGYRIEEGSSRVEVRGFMGTKFEADFKILTKTHYDLGFKKNGQGHYDLVADWELLPKVSGIEQASFAATLKKEYAKEAILEMAQSKGYEVAIENNNADGSVELVVTQW